MTGFSIQNTVNGYMNPVSRIGSLIIHVEGLEKERTINRNPNIEEAFRGISPKH
jgi:hypothetical protein